MKSFLIIFFFSASLFANDLPDLGSSFDNLISSADEKKIKFQIMQQVFSSNEVIRDPEINDYLKNFGENLVKQGINGKYDIFLSLMIIQLMLLQCLGTLLVFILDFFLPQIVSRSLQVF
jgi:predicted Zn-dependent protease